MLKIPSVQLELTRETSAATPFMRRLFGMVNVQRASATSKLLREMATGWTAVPTAGLTAAG